MNNARREALAKIAAALAGLRDELEQLQADEQDYLDNMPESLQGGEKGAAAEEVVSELENALSELDGAISSIETAAA